MSNENNEREILSAYFDGELSPADRQRAEQMLEDSVNVRREIDEIAELSELVKSLPTATAPAELLPAVMQQAERETLLPSPPPAAAAKQKSRTLLATLAGVAATAAAILLTIQFLPPSTDSHPQATANYKTSDRTLVRNEPSDADPFKTAEAPVTFAEQNGSIEAAGMSGNSLAEAKTPASALPMAPQADATKDLRGSFARRAAGKAEEKGDGQPVTQSQPSGSAGGSGSLSSSVSSDSLSMNSQLLKNARRGDEFRFFSTDGTKVTTYMVTVVDVNKALDKLELLLMENEIPARTLVGEEEASRQAKPGEGKDIAGRKRKDDSDEATPNGHPPSRMIAVYVETTPDRFRSTMREMYQDKMLADLHVKPPVDESQIEVADLGKSPRQLFSEIDRADYGKKTAAAPAEPTEFAEAKPSAPVDAPVPTAASSRKPKQSAPQNAPKTNDKSAPANRFGRDSKRPDANKNDLRQRQQNRDNTKYRFADKEHAATPSFQVRVQLAPISKFANGPPTAEREIQMDQRNEPQTEVPAAPQPVDGLQRKLQRLTSNSDNATPVRVLFVFRQAPHQDKPHP